MTTVKQLVERWRTEAVALGGPVAKILNSGATELEVVSESASPPESKWIAVSEDEPATGCNHLHHAAGAPCPASEDEWIACSDTARGPEYKQHCWVSDGDTVWDDSVEAFNSTYGQYGSVVWASRTEGVTHWQPYFTPSAPKVML